MTSNPKPNHPRRVASGAIWLVYRWKLPSKVNQCIRPPSRSRKPLRLAEDILRLASWLAG